MLLWHVHTVRVMEAGAMAVRFRGCSPPHLTSVAPKWGMGQPTSQPQFWPRFARLAMNAKFGTWDFKLTYSHGFDHKESAQIICWSDGHFFAHRIFHLWRHNQIWGSQRARPHGGKGQKGGESRKGTTESPPLKFLGATNITTTPSSGELI